MGNKQDLNLKCYKTLLKYVQKYTPEKLEDLENNLFGEKISRRRRVIIESDRVKRVVSKEPFNHVEAMDEIEELNYYLKLVNMGDTIIDELYSRIIKLNIICDLPIRLSSGIYPLCERLSKEVKISNYKSL